MNKQENNSEDLLRQFINPEMIEKAPEGFANRVMTRINTETESVRTKSLLQNKSFIPIISVVISIVLIMAAFLLSGSDADSSELPFTEFLKNIKLSLPEINLASVFRFSLPSVVIYVFLGILVLSLFDRALQGVFHREK
jgi:hypothetical protein